MKAGLVAVGSDGGQTRVAEWKNRERRKQLGKKQRQRLTKKEKKTEEK